jgi:hypothetical protein
MTKGKRVDLQTCDSLIGCRLLPFLRMSGTETVVMIQERLMVEMTVVMWIVPIFLVLVMQQNNFHIILVANPFAPFE